MEHFNRLFGIGLNKTATTSLQAALEILGIPTMHYTARLKQVLEDERMKGLTLLSSLTEYQAFLDYPIYEIYPELDVVYPGSKFVFTIRDLDTWLDSRERHVRRNQKDPNYKGKWLVVDRKAWELTWHQHQQQVADYFRNRSEDLLYMNIFAGDGWDELCSFLKMPVPDAPFPRKNSAKADTKRRSRNSSFMRVIRQQLARIRNLLIS
jgi:hypothetical protein